MTTQTQTQIEVEVIPISYLIDRLKKLRQRLHDGVWADPHSPAYTNGYDAAVRSEIEFLAELLEPDPVCGCGKTSEGLCPRCGQNMS